MKTFKGMVVTFIVGALVQGGAIAQEQINLAELSPPPPMDLPLVALEAQPDAANYYSAGRDWPPLPFNPFFGLTNVPIYFLQAANCPNGLPYLLFDDRAIVAAELLLEAEAQQRGVPQTKMASRLEEVFTPQYAARGLVAMTNDLQIDIEDATNGVVSLTVLNPTSMTNNPVWDLYATTNLSVEGGGWNATNWTWLARTEPGQTNLLLAMPSETEAYFRLADTNDVDADSLPDVFELLVSHSDPTTNDSDGDSLLDAFEWTHFGDFNQSATNDYDGDGTNNYDEFIASSNPNDLKFTTHFANLFVNQTTVSGTCAVQGGVPYVMAVLVNSTNLATANWQPYSPSFDVTLGGGDGVYAVRVYLAGRSGAFPPVMDYTELTLDRVAPVLMITNPITANATVTKPYLQLLGNANEPLSVLTYNLTNSAGAWTNLPAYVVDQEMDTNAFDFSTNYFQAYDIPLVTNANYLTLRVTDRAGNTRSTNLIVTLDYTGATNPPVFAPRWPTNGMHLSGESFYMRGQIDDETATLSAQWLDDEGTTNTTPGIVERNGTFWVENLPLQIGTNELKLIAVNAAGHPSTNALSVVRSELLLTITSTPEGTALYNAVGNVSGTVSEPDCPVTVNGVAAEVTGTNWNASNVPLYGMGTATFDISANPSNNVPVHFSEEKAMPAIVRVTKHLLRQTFERSLSGMTWNTTWTKDYRAEFYPGTNGNWEKRYWGRASEYGAISAGGLIENWITDYIWSHTNTLGTYYTVDSVYGEGGGSIPEDSLVRLAPDEQVDDTPVEGPQIRVQNYYANGARYEWTSPVFGHAVLTLVARTFETLFTGGKAEVGWTSLFHISASMVEIRQPEGYLYYHTPGTTVLAAEQKIMGQTPEGSGKVRAALAANAQVGLGIVKPGGKHNGAWPNKENSNLKLETVTFGGAGYHSIKCDTNAAIEYTGPHWQTNFTAHTSASYPVLYESGNKLVASVSCKVNPAEIDTRLKIRGEGGGFIFEGTKDLSANETTWSLSTTSTVATASNTVNLFNLSINWSYAETNETTFHPLGTSSNRVYVSWHAPTTANLFHTVVDVACRNATSMTIESNIVVGIWGDFSDRSVVKADGTGPMKYWGNYVLTNVLANPATLLGGTVGDLVNYSDGRCGAWARFFRDTLKAQGITNSAVVGVLPNFDGWSAHRLRVKNQNVIPIFLTPPGPPQEMLGIPGQGNADPISIFVDHAIVTYGGKFYDPSYGGTTFTDIHAWQMGSLDVVSFDLGSKMVVMDSSIGGTNFVITTTPEP